MKRRALAEQLVERARRLGADEAEAFVMKSSQTEIKIRDGRPETVNYIDTSGYGLRVLKDGRMGFASSNNIDASEADDMIRKLIAFTERHTPDDHNVLPDPVTGTGNHVPEQFDDTLRAVPVEQKIEKAISMERAAREADDRIRQIPWLQYGDASRQYAIVSSRGIHGEARRTETYGFVMALGMNPDADARYDPATTQTGVGIGVKAYFNDLDFAHIGRTAARYALRMLGAVEGKTGEVQAVFPPETGYNFLRLIADLVAADLVQKKKSLFTGKLGEMIASDLVTIIDDGRLEGGLASAAVDYEGVPTTATEIIQKGKLSAFLYDSYSAHRDNTVSTGNASRVSFDSKPHIAPSNFYMRAGASSRESVIAAVKNGLYVTEVSGLHASVDQVTGNFSIPGKGICIADGELTTPVSGITISGNIFDFFKAIDAVAEDFTWEPRGYVIGVPTFRVSPIKVSGK